MKKTLSLSCDLLSFPGQMISILGLTFPDLHAGFHITQVVTHLISVYLRVSVLPASPLPLSPPLSPSLPLPLLSPRLAAAECMIERAHSEQFIFFIS